MDGATVGLIYLQHFLIIHELSIPTNTTPIILRNHEVPSSIVDVDEWILFETPPIGHFDSMLVPVNRHEFFVCVYSTQYVTAGFGLAALVHTLRHSIMLIDPQFRRVIIFYNLLIRHLGYVKWQALTIERSTCISRIQFLI